MILASLLFTALPHPMSVSSTRIEVAGASVAVRIRCEDQTLRECLPLDVDGDDRIDADELARGRDAIAAYVVGGWKLFDHASRSLSCEVVGLELVAGSSPPKIDIRLGSSADRDLESLRIDFALFREADPLHRDHCEIVWNGGATVGRVLWVEDPTWSFSPEFEASAFDVLGAFVHHGIEHILFGLDHVAFVVALLIGARKWRAILLVVSAFTVAHSITLALAAFQAVSIPPTIVEPVIALSIAWVAARNLWGRAARALWIEAFLFGLVHGLGFAGAIGETLASEPRQVAALFGFNLGVEAGQLAIVIASLALFGMLELVGKRTRRGPSMEGRAPRILGRVASILVAALGVYWFVERVSA